MVRKLRINFTLWTTNPSGGVRHILEVANSLTQRGHKVTITSLGGDHSWFPFKPSVNYVKPPGWLKLVEPAVKLIKKRSIRYSDIDEVTKLLRLNINVDLVKPLAEAIPQCDVNVATFCLTVPAVYRCGKGKGFYYIQHYEPALFEDSGDILKAKETYYLPLRKIVTSRWLERLVYRMTGDKAIARVGIGINPEVFYPRPMSKNTKEKVVMAIIRGVKWKNELDVLKIMNIVAEKIPDIKLLAVGKKEALVELAKIVKPEFKIDFPGWANDDLMARLFSLADVFISTSKFEGGNSPPLEAMACGTPVVTYKAPWNENFIVNKVNKRNALVASDINEFAKHVISLLTDDDLSRKLKEEGLETAKLHTWDAVTNRVEEAFINSLRTVESSHRLGTKQPIPHPPIETEK
ncbi:glycosyltransferase family 4 protein [Chloroflexota bacterium]